MHTRQIHISNTRLTEGSVLSFKILRTVSMDGDKHFILLDPYGYKLMLPVAFYTHYGFAEGQTLRCRVDKVNCNGRVFLEPVHPYYEEGQSYTFPVLSSGRRINLAGMEQQYLVVEDRLGLRWEVVVPREWTALRKGDRVLCRIERIKKGVLYLQLAEDGCKPDYPQAGSCHVFEVVNERTDPSTGQVFYVVKDEKGGGHLLGKKHFVHYGLKPGKKIRCMVGPFMATGFFELEPEHPCYEAGKVYEMELNHAEELIFPDGSVQKVLVFRDCFGEDVKLPADEETLKRYGEKTKIHCLVKRIHKSRLELEVHPGPLT